MLSSSLAINLIARSPALRWRKLGAGLRHHA